MTARVSFRASTNTNSPGATVNVSGYGATAGVFQGGVFEDGVFEENRARTLNINTSVDVSKINQVVPVVGGANSAGAVQRVGWRVTVDGVSHDDCVPNTNIVVGRRIDRPVQIGSFESVALDGNSDLGNPLNLGAPITGLKTITMELAYRSDDGVSFSEPLITNGTADASQRTINGLAVDAVSVADSGQQYIDTPVTLKLDAGHASGRGEIISQLATLAGVPSQDIAGTFGILQKAVDIDKGDWISLAQDLAEVRGYRLLWDTDGTMIAVPRGDEWTRGPIKWNFDLTNLVFGVNGRRQGGITISPASEAWTKFSMRGSKQVVKGVNCGLTSTASTVTTTGLFTPNRLQFQQNSGGTVSASGLSAGTPSTRSLSEIFTLVTEDCGDIITSVTDTVRLLNIPKARYFRTTAGAVSTYSVCYLEANSASEVGWQYGQEIYALGDRVIDQTFYNADGFVDKEVREIWGWYNPERHVRSRTDLDDPWNTQTATSSWYDSGNGTGLQFETASFQIIERRTVEYGVGGSTFIAGAGYLQSRTTTVEKWAAVPGQLYLYGGGREFGESQESFQVVSKITEQFQFLGSGFRKTVGESTVGGALLPTTVTTGPGGPPSAKKRKVNENGADRYEQQEIKAECEAPGLLSVRRPREDNERVAEWAETEQELALICERMIIAGQTPEISFTLPANPRIKVGDWGHLSGPAGMEVDFVVVAATTSGPKTGPILTEISALVPLGGVNG